jgi:hypothetical protein
MTGEDKKYGVDHQGTIGNTDQVHKLIEFCNQTISNLINRKFYGEVVVKFENGKMTVIKVTESYKI